MTVANEIANFINRNPLLNTIFLLLALISIGISLFLYFASRKQKKPCYTIKTLRLLRKDKIDNIGDIEILYRGDRIDNLSLSIFAIWNVGRDTIESNDVAPIDQLRISISSKYKLLSADIVNSPIIANNFSLIQDLGKGEIFIKFDYFHRNEGVVVRIFHTGESYKDICFNGTIKGVKNILYVEPDEYMLLYSLMKRIIRLTRLDKIHNSSIRFLYASLVSIVALPIIFPTFIVGFIEYSFRRVPSDFDLRKMKGFL